MRNDGFCIKISNEIELELVKLLAKLDSREWPKGWLEDGRPNKDIRMGDYVINFRDSNRYLSWDEVDVLSYPLKTIEEATKIITEKKDQIKIGENPVFFDEKARVLHIGCQTVPFALAKKIVDKINELESF